MDQNLSMILNDRKSYADISLMQNLYVDKNQQFITSGVLFWE